ncbi:hypothetical protein FRC03_009643 [Tulasnella sp. 419]|nr:hypothetical protein FRC03_009643 [Tulasnella sp. 419]
MRSIAANPYLLRTLVWALNSPFSYGYHIACLNQVQLALTCAKPPSSTGALSLPTCVPMSTNTFGLITSIFTIGGLLGSLVASRFMHRFGRKGAIKINASLICAGSLIMTIAWNTGLLALGRFLIGIGAGIAICVLPIYLSEVAPPKVKGSVGVFNQLSIVIGLLLAQLVGVYLSTPGTQRWRFVFLVSAALNIIQLLFSPTVSDTPSWLNAVGREQEAKAVGSKLWKDDSPTLASSTTTHPEEEGLLRNNDDEPPQSRRSETNIAPLTIPELFKLEALRKPVAAVLLAMFSQQISGINAVIFYSNDILSRVVPVESASYISLGIAVLNALMTFPAITLIERLGRRKLLFGSMLGTLVSTVALAVGLNTGTPLLSSIGILTFVGSFAIGLGPVPYVLIGELVPFYASSPLSSTALSLGWVTNFVVGVGFLPLRDWLSRPGEGERRKGEGNVFFVFAGAFALCVVILSRLYR